MTLFHPASGEVRVKGVKNCTNAVLHPWLQSELSAVLNELPLIQEQEADKPFKDWEYWYRELTRSATRSKTLPPLRVLLVLDNLTGHKTPEFVLWCFAHGIALLYTPLGGSWLKAGAVGQRP